MEIILVDTCILIDYTRRMPEVVDFIEQIGKDNLCINSIIEMELLQGALNGKELEKIKKDLQQFLLLPIQQKIMKDATQLLSTYKLSHQAKIPDMIIAATARFYEIELRSYNLKDFRFVPHLKVSNELL